MLLVYLLFLHLLSVTLSCHKFSIWYPKCNIVGCQFEVKYVVEVSVMGTVSPAGIVRTVKADQPVFYY